MRYVVAILGVLVLLSSPIRAAGSWDEYVDGGDDADEAVPGQDTTSITQIDTIYGNFDVGGGDDNPDVFRVDAGAAGTFSITNRTESTQLTAYFFEKQGVGVYRLRGTADTIGGPDSYTSAGESYVLVTTFGYRDPVLTGGGTLWDGSSFSGGGNSGSNIDYRVDFAVTPEPGSLLLALTGLGIGAIKSRRRRNQRFPSRAET